jgi:hypothetical protein
MDQLDKLKNIWRDQGESPIKFSEGDIFEMVHKKSSSIVKWILIISLLEFILPNLIVFFTDLDATQQLYENYGLTNIMKIYTIIHIVVILGFIYCFYKNYRNISAEESVKKLLKSILNTRKTVKYYIYYNIAMAAIIGLHMFYKIFNSTLFVQKLPENTNMLLIWFIALGLFAFALFLFWGFYRIIYGILLKKLNRNYKELRNNN